LGDDASGRHIGTLLAAHSDVDCVIGTRTPGRVQEFAKRIGAAVVAVDVDDMASLGRALDGVFAVVKTAGPFVAGRYPVAQRCAACGVHYVDIASAHPYVSGVSVLDRRAKASGSLIVTGASIVPAVSAVLVDYVVGEFDRVSEIHTAVAPLDNGTDWLASMRAMRAFSGQPMRVKEAGRWRHTFAWSEPARVDFPAPVGRRRAYLCDVADLALFPQRYGARTVTFRAGFARPSVNYAMAVVGRVSRRRVNKEGGNAGEANELSGLQDMLQSTTGIQVVVRGHSEGREVAHAVSLISRDRGAMAIACSPALALLKTWARLGIAEAGARTCVDLLTLDAIKRELLGNDIVLVRS
jgi:saccharopine dehydrogenase-like NADP-dependent oxidoreductase